jgi:glycolate oxidase FAD binding subunit
MIAPHLSTAVARLPLLKPCDAFDPMNSATNSVSGKTVRDMQFDFRALLGPEHVRTANSTDVVLGSRPELVLEPATEVELASVLRLANEAGLAVIPRGGGTKLGWGNPPARADLVLSTLRLDHIVEHAWADLTVTVEAGCTIGKLQERLAQHGQRLALDPLWPERATIGGVLSTNDSGALRLRFGALRDLIIGVTLALSDGTLARSGGKVVKNVAGYDLPKLATGALGTLGIVTRAVFRLHPLPQNTRTLSMGAGDTEQTEQLLLAVQDSKLAHTALQARLGSNQEPTADILFEGTAVGLKAQEARLRELAAPASVSESPSAVWNARQELLALSKTEKKALAKISTLPAKIAQTIRRIRNSAGANELGWNIVVQATGIGWLRLEGTADACDRALRELRGELEENAGSLAILERPPGLGLHDAWGTPSDAFALMLAVKQQFDPRATLNPARFLGGL